MQRNEKKFIGIDVSKATLDVALYGTKYHIRIANNSEGFKQLQTWLKSMSVPLEDCWFVFEYTGGYEYRLVQFCASKHIVFTRVPGLEIKKSLGIQRGKNDKIDARRIAEYAYEKQEKIQAQTPRNAAIERLRLLLSQRNGFVDARKINATKLKELLVMADFKTSDPLIKRYNKAIHDNDRMIKDIEAEMMQLMSTDSSLQTNFNLITSIPGIGKVNAWMTLIYTDNFTRFKDGRKYGSYSGVVPFEYTSGTSIRYKSRVNHLANKEIKASLDMAAKVSIQFDPEINAYYQRRKEIGKHHMSIMNEVKFKLILRMFAVVNKQTPYVKKQQIAA